MYQLEQILWDAVLRCDRPRAQAAIAAGADLSFADGVLLKSAVCSGSVDIVEDLIASGASLPSRSLLPDAAFYGHCEIAHLLLRAAPGAGADEALEQSSARNHPGMVSLLLGECSFEQPTLNKALEAAVINDARPVIHLLLAAGADKVAMESARAWAQTRHQRVREVTAAIRWIESLSAAPQEFTLGH